MSFQFPYCFRGHCGLIAEMYRNILLDLFTTSVYLAASLTMPQVKYTSSNPNVGAVNFLVTEAAEAPNFPFLWKLLHFPMMNGVFKN